MQISEQEAATTLKSARQIGQQVRQSLIYTRISFAIILWGVLTTLAYILSYMIPHLAYWIWKFVQVFGFAASILTGLFSSYESGLKDIDYRLMWGFVIFFVNGLVWTTFLVEFTPRQLDTFWSTYFMLAYILAGLWIGPAIVGVGISISILTLLSYWFAGNYFDLAMALINGLGLIFAGVWMRRA